MSDNIKLVIEIPKPMYECIQNKTYCGSLYEYLENGIPLDDVKAEIKEKCDGINDLVDGELSYPLHRGVQELMCDILEILDRRIEGASK